MFHAVNQMPGAEDEDILALGTGASLPMFREPCPENKRGISSHHRRGSSSKSGGDSSSTGGSGGIVGRAGPALAASSITSAVAGGSATGTGSIPRSRALLRSRRGGGGIELGTIGSSSKTFAGPDGLEPGFAGESGTFRWDATVADAATVQHENQGEQEEEEEDDEHEKELDEEGGEMGGVSQHRRGGARGMLGRGVRRGSTKATSRGGRLAMRPGGEDGVVGGAGLLLSPKRWFIILPESRMDQIFDHLGDLLTMYVVVAIPLFVSFQHIENMHAEDWYAFNIGVDLLFLADLAARFLTAYHDDYADRLVVKPTAIARQYCRGLLVPDLIASIPLTIILGTRMFSISNKITRLARMPQTMRLIRSIKLLSEEAEETHHKNILLAMYNLVKVILYILVVMHWVACGWHLLADLEDADLSWIVKDGLEDAPASKLYVTSVYWTVTTLSTVGYGDIFASTIAERTYCILVMLTGATMYALAIGAVSHIISTVVARHSQSRRIERHAEAFIRMHSLPLELASQIMRTLNISGETQEMIERRAQSTLELLPPRVRTSTLLCIYRPQISRIAFLKKRRETQPVFVTSMVRSLHAHDYLKAGDEMFPEDSDAKEMIFLVRGRALITSRGTEVGRLSSGSCFGVTAAMHSGRIRDNVTCVTDCEVYTVKGETLRQIARMFPGPMGELKRESERSVAGRPGSGDDAPPPLPNAEDRPGWANDELEPTIDAPSRSKQRQSLLQAGEGSLRYSSSTENDGLPRRRRSDRTASPLAGEVPVFPPVAIRGGIGDGGPSMSPSSHGSTRSMRSSGVFRDSASLHACSATERSMRTLARCLGEATQMESEVWDRLHLLTDSLRKMRQCMNECGVAHEQVVREGVAAAAAAAADTSDLQLINVSSTG